MMKIDKKGQVIDSDIFKSVIKTTKRMNYHDVDDLFKYIDIQNSVISSNDMEKEQLNRITTVEEKYKDYISHFLRMRRAKKFA